MAEPPNLEDLSRAFADEIQSLLDAVLPGEHRIVSVKAEGDERFVIRPEQRHLALTVDGEELAQLSLAMYQAMDRAGQFLKTVRSDFRIFSALDRTPLARLEYRHDHHTDPICHWQIHAERGALSHLLARAHAVRPDEVKAPHMLSSMHIPVGGERYRPGLEDVLEFLIRDCGVDRRNGWRSALEEGRERWRLKQLRTAVRDYPGAAAEVLTSLGWDLREPARPPGINRDVFRKW